MRKALSLRQPWLFGIFNLGKDVENRDWQLSNPSLHVARRLIASGERFLLHASKAMTRNDRDGFRATVLDLVVAKKLPDTKGTLPDVGDLPRGGIVGAARLTCAVHEENFALDCGDEESKAAARASPWLFGVWGFGLADVVTLPFVPLNGAQGFFDVDATALGIEVPS